MTQRAAGSAPRRLAVFGDFPHHRDADGQLYGLEPVVAQLERWATLFDEMVLCGPLLPGPPPSGFAAYQSSKFRMEEVPRAGGNTFKAKLAMIPKVPIWAWRTRRVARAADAVHIRCPCNIGMVALLSTWKAVPYRHAMYAGVWRAYDGEPRFFRYQRELLGSRWFEGPVSVYATADPERPNLEPFFSPSYDQASWDEAAPAVAAARERIENTRSDGPWRLVIVGRLTPNKNQATAIAAVAELVRGGLDATLDILGGGPELGRLEAQAASAGIGDRVRFHGMVDYSEVLSAFAASDVQILCTRQEGYGKVLLEGMVYGVVPVFADSPVAPEIAGHGTRGVVIDPNDAAAIAAAVRGLVDDRERWLAMSDAARAYAKDLTLDAFEGRIQEMLERQWNVRFPSDGAEAVS